VSDQEILALVRLLVNGMLPLESFEDAFLTATWDNNSQLVREVTAILAESSGNAGDDVAMDRLRSLVVPYVTHWRLLHVGTAGITFTSTGMPKIGEMGASANSTITQLVTAGSDS
jgi:hypothetical protein